MDEAAENAAKRTCTRIALYNSHVLRMRRNLLRIRRMLRARETIICTTESRVKILLDPGYWLRRHNRMLPAKIGHYTNGRTTLFYK